MQPMLQTATRLVLGCAAVALFVATISAQAPGQPSPGVAPSEANHFIETPKGWVHPMTPWGEPDLEGTWPIPAGINLERGACPAGGERETGVILHQAHILTPETAETTHYFWATTRTGPPSPEGDRMLAGLMEQAFREEDKPIIEAAYANLDGADFWDAGPFSLRVGGGGTRARRMIQKLMKQEEVGR